jgi:hypothetical protein
LQDSLSYLPLTTRWSPSSLSILQPTGSTATSRSTLTHLGFPWTFKALQQSFC